MSSEPASGDSYVDPTTVETMSELATAFQRLRGTRSYGDLDRAVAPQRLPRSTVSNMLNAKSVPIRENVVLFLAACGLNERAREPWLRAWERVSTAHLRQPAGAVRVREARPRLLGVHASIQMKGAEGELPVYVPRDLDGDLLTVIGEMAERGGLVVMVGGSSVGKTRSLFEAVRTALPEWWLIHPDPSDPQAVRALAAEPPRRTVLWLDELQNYLDRPSGLQAASVRVLINSGVVLVATVWPDEYMRRSTLRIPGQPDQNGNDREILGMAHTIDLPDTFSIAERRRGQALAATDPRVGVALNSLDAGFTQVLAAGPELVRWWENAPTPYGKGVITAALDAHRVGARAPFTRVYLTAAAPAYLTPAEQATAPADWFDRALDYATTRLRGAAATMTPVPAGMGIVSGYTVADYLYQHVRVVRRTADLPDVVWQALTDHHHLHDADALADNAERRDQTHHAETIYQRAAAAGDRNAAQKLTLMLGRQGDIAKLRQRMDTGDAHAAISVAGMLAERNRVEEAIEVLRSHADSNADAWSDGWFAAAVLADLLAKCGRVKELRQLAGAGDEFAAVRLADLRVDRLLKRGRVGAAIAVLQVRADADELNAARKLAELLAKQGWADKALAILRRCVDDGDGEAESRLAELLAEQGLVEELRQRANAGDGNAARRLADLLAEEGQVDEAIEVFRQRADAGDGDAVCRLAELLAEQGLVEELRQRANAGDGNAARRLADLLAEEGQVDEAIIVLRPGADAGQWDTAVRLINLLTAQDRVDELRLEVAAGTPTAAHRLRELTNRSGR